MLSVTNRPLNDVHIVLNVILQSDTNKSLMMSVIILSIFMLSVIMQSVVYSVSLC